MGPQWYSLLLTKRLLGNTGVYYLFLCLSSVPIRLEYRELIRIGALFTIITLAPNIWHMVNIRYLLNEQMNPPQLIWRSFICLYYLGPGTLVLRKYIIMLGICRNLVSLDSAFTAGGVLLWMFTLHSLLVHRMP